MSLPPGAPFHNFAPELPPESFHAYYSSKSLDLGMKHVAQLVVNRARNAGYNPREGHVTIYFDDAGVGAKWVPIPKEKP